MKVIGVIGAGTMGIGVAINLLQKNLIVKLVDINKDQLTHAKKEIEETIIPYSMIRKLEINEDVVKNNIQYTTDITVMESADIIIENIIEDIEAKQNLYAQLEQICNEHCIFMVNTSCIPIKEIGQDLSIKARMLGVHFMNPVPLINTVEAIKAEFTDDDNLAAAKAFLKILGKDSVVVNDSPGFVSNRISHLMMNEAMYLIDEGVGSPEDIDKIFKQCYGHKMGPLETADLIGLDVVKDSLTVLGRYFRGNKFQICPLLARMVDEQCLGKKTNQGFYNY